jgi:prophage antirepressor-like protein
MTRTPPTKDSFLSNNNMPIFKSELTNGIELRILGSHDDPWFVAKDIATMLEYTNTNKAITDHIDKEDILTYNFLVKNGGNESLSPLLQPQTKLINESGLYCLILRSKNEKAKLFKKWVTSEVLPSLRKSGEYKFQEHIKLLTQEKHQAIQEKEQAIQEKATITRQLSSVTKNHNEMLKRRRRGVYEIGNVVYILSHVAFTTYYQDDYYKIGISTQSITETTPAFKNRLASYKQGAPCEYKVHYLIYVENNKLIEDILKLKFKDQLNPSNGEWIKGVKLEEIIKSIRYLCDYIGLPCKEHSIMKHKNIVNDGKVLDYEDEEETELLSDKCAEINVEGDKESSIEFIGTDEENTYSDEEDEIEESEVKQVEMIEEIDKYDAKQLTKMLLQFKLPVSGNKDAKKTRIRQYAVKNRAIVEEYILNAMELPKQTFCIDCGLEITYKAVRCDPCSKKSSRVVIDRPDYQTLKKQYEDCGKNMRKLAMIHNVSDKAVAKWFDKYEKELCITQSFRKKIKPKSTITKPSDKDLLYDKNVLKLNYTQLGSKYNVDRTTARDWLSTL